MATESNALGRVVTNAYNSMGLLTNRYDGRTTDSYSYDYEGRLLAWMRNGEMLATNSYDAFGRLEWSRNAAGLEIIRTYDDLNRPTSETYDNQGNISVNSNRYDCCFIDLTSNRNGRVWLYEYNDNGEKLSETNPDGLTTTYSFEVEGMPLVITNALEWTTRQYTSDGQLKRVAYPENRPYDLAEHAENYWYDNAGHLTKRQTVSGAFYSYEYDLLGRLTALHVPVESNLSVGVEAYVLALTNIYDAMGQRAVWIRDIRGLAVSNEFNAIRQLLKTHYPDSTTEEWTYNPWGQMVGFKDRASNVQSNVYDDRGRLIRHFDARQLVTYVAPTPMPTRWLSSAILRVRSGDIPTMRNGGQPRLSSRMTPRTPLPMRRWATLHKTSGARSCGHCAMTGKTALPAWRSRERSWKATDTTSSGVGCGSRMPTD